MRSYTDRREAGRILAGQLREYADRVDTLVLGLPRGGVVVAHEVAAELHLPLDIFLVRKLGVPGEPELAMGAVAEGGILLLNDSIIDYLAISRDTIDKVAQTELLELQRRQVLYRDGREPLSIEGKTTIVIDDGVATGATIRAALKALRRMNPRKLIAAAPVGAQATCMELRGEADEVVCVLEPEPLMAVGAWYEDFEQVTDQEVKQLLKGAALSDPPHQDAA